MVSCLQLVSFVSCCFLKSRPPLHVLRHFYTGCFLGKQAFSGHFLLTNYCIMLTVSCRVSAKSRRETNSTFYYEFFSVVNFSTVKWIFQIAGGLFDRIWPNLKRLQTPSHIKNIQSVVWKCIFFYCKEIRRVLSYRLCCQQNIRASHIIIVIYTSVWFLRAFFHIVKPRCFQ